MKRNKSKAKVLEGVVLSHKMKKTIVVMVISKFRHPIYSRLIIKREKYKAHDAESKAKTGDRVKIIQCRPYSKEKRFRLLEVLK